MDDFTFPLRAYLGDPVAQQLPAPGSAANPPAKSRAGRIKRVNDLLGHPACAADRAEVKQLLCNRIMPRELRRITSALERKIEEAGKRAR